MADWSERELQAHYGRMERGDAYVGKCKMWLPDGLAGKKVLDVGCRRGKGVYKIAERVGAAGLAVGMDWDAAFLARAREGAAAARERAGLACDNMRFVEGYPETADAAVAPFAPFDVVIANSVMNLAFDRPAAYAAIVRTLRPGGLFYHASVTADADPDAAARRAACVAGDARAAATSEKTLLADLAAAGFASSEVVWRDADFADAPGVRAVVVAARV